MTPDNLWSRAGSAAIPLSEIVLHRRAQTVLKPQRSLQRRSQPPQRELVVSNRASLLSHMSRMTHGPDTGTRSTRREKGKIEKAAIPC